ncbi:hypothetical protein DFJ58DRAFT_192264 [Suillus subalutaceus]|uniref:uncharacterized protein n=1 Tax=Suillus subalutaceus TaxID=48586 RepID=UPI001B87EB40|nr:uncharacterized protein DFJ58DRAFT_192264 [Suillus subalutaceus]KAG1835984.1 hypothetical protein DFJ58DRAFT_192264 [Suillus subalutaceus]
MPRKRPSHIANLAGTTGQRRQKFNDKENETTFPGSHPTNPPLCWHSKERETQAARSMVDEPHTIPLGSAGFHNNSPDLDWLRFSTRSLRFMDAYRKGLDGKQAAWASKRYRGHRVLPEAIMAELGTAGLI